MAENQYDAEKFAGGGARPSYGVPNKAVPLPRQWQLPQPQTPAPRGRTDIHQFYPGSTDAGNWLQRAPRRQTKNAILIGLGLLAVLATVTIGLRIMEPSALTALPTEPPTRAYASADAANAMRSPPLAAARSEDSDPFDEIEPESRLLPEPLPVPPQMPAVSLAPAGTLAIESPAGLPASPARHANIGPACVDALRAMGLCPDMK